MAEFTAKDVMKLREQTGAGMMDCKRALVDADGDFEKAGELLRERGIAKAAKRASKIAAECSSKSTARAISSRRAISSTRSWQTSRSRS